jgi:hypothetical protein
MYYIRDKYVSLLEPQGPDIGGSRITCVFNGEYPTLSDEKTLQLKNSPIE